MKHNVLDFIHNVMDYCLPLGESSITFAELMFCHTLKLQRFCSFVLLLFLFVFFVFFVDQQLKALEHSCKFAV